jgi:hypothetical protein
MTESRPNHVQLEEVKTRLGMKHEEEEEGEGHLLEQCSIIYDLM